MGKSIFVSTFCLWLLITGCAISGRDNTPNRRPEITVTGTDSKLIGLKLTDEMHNFGYSIREQSDHSIVFEKQITDPNVATRLGWRYDMYPRSRVSYTLLEQDGTVRVVADLKVITNPGSRFERGVEATKHPDSTSIHEVLRRVEYHLEHEKKRGLQDTDGKPSLR